MKLKLNDMIFASMIAALYAAVTFAVPGLSFLSVQFRLSEALITMACISPAAIPGLAVGCMIANITSPFGIADVLLGGLMTLLASLWAYFTRKITVKKMPLLSPVGSILLNSLYVAFLDAFAGGTSGVFFLSFMSVFLSETLICYLLGMPLFLLVNKINVS